MSDESRDKGEWAEVADEGIVPHDQGPEAEDPELGSDVVGATTGDDTPATESGIDPAAGDDADAVTDGGPEPPEDAEPDLRDAASGPREVDR